MFIIGRISGPDSSYTGWNVKDGIPVYALVDGEWRQGFSTTSLPIGTELAIPGAYRERIENYESEPVNLSSPPPQFWPAPPHPDYAGQLSSSFQAELRSKRSGLKPSDCSFYHTVQFEDGEIFLGAWDLRNRESAYLGNIDPSGKRILELGPASGHMTFFLESRGAQVVTFDVGFDALPDVIASPDLDSLQQRTELLQFIGTVQNAWWYVHERIESKSLAAYGNIYALPQDLGKFDVGFFGSILLHLRNPYDAIAQVAPFCDEMLVITEPSFPERVGRDAMIFSPTGTDNLSVWWNFSSGEYRTHVQAPRVWTSDGDVSHTIAASRLELGYAINRAAVFHRGGQATLTRRRHYASSSKGIIYG